MILSRGVKLVTAKGMVILYFLRLAIFSFFPLVPGLGCKIKLFLISEFLFTTFVVKW